MIGEYIRKCRIDKSLSQKELAEKLGITFQSVSKWERGETLPDTSLLLKLADILETTTDKILSGGKLIVSSQRRVDVNRLKEGLQFLANLKEIFGSNSYFYQYAIKGINDKMNIDFEKYMQDDYAREILLIEAIIQCILDGYKVSLTDLDNVITNKKLIDIVKRYL